MNNDDLRRRAHLALTNFVNRKSESPVWEGRKIVIYGAGGFGRDLAKALLLQPNVTILGFLDQKGSDQKVLDDLRAHNLESSVAKSWQAENPVVVIGVFNPSASLREIKSLLTQIGFSVILTPMEAYMQLNKELDWRFWMGTPQDYSAAADPIEKVGGLWADKTSEQLFLETLLFRVAFDLEKASSPTDVSFQYADPSLPRWQEPLRLADGGAYNGDTFQKLQKHSYHFATIHAFEPDAQNFKELQTTASAFSPETQISLWPCGLWSSTCRLNFSEGEGTSSKLSASGPSMIPVVALDDVLHGQPINLIKLDIEGAEPDALQGARRLIEKYRPCLAVCLYHYPHHLWSIPLWVKELNLDYRLYCRAYAQNTFETVLYAIPN
jgi:FkbM family methyltransferase